MSIVFLHVGDDQLVKLFVKSIKLSCKNIEIIQCSDLKTPAVDGVDFVFRHDGDITNLMTFRLECFSNLRRRTPAIYLDTDMLVLNDLSAILVNTTQVGLCRREFGRAGMFNINFNGLDLSEYSGMTLDEVYPFIACCTLTPSFEFWSRALTTLKNLDPKFHYWYGDQEAIKIVAGQMSDADKLLLPESVYGCLPEYIQNTQPKIIHFKGPSRKKLMRDFLSCP
jgi:hypothetical protein